VQNYSLPEEKDRVFAALKDLSSEEKIGKGSED